MMTKTTIAPKVWQFIQTLEPEVAQYLLAQPTKVERLAAAAQLSPLPPNYSPGTIKLVVDGLLIGCWEQGTSLMPSPLASKNYKPKIIELFLDGELAWAMCFGRQVVDRTQNLGPLSQFN